MTEIAMPLAGQPYAAITSPDIAAGVTRLTRQFLAIIRGVQLVAGNVAVEREFGEAVASDEWDRLKQGTERDDPQKLLEILDLLRGEIGDDDAEVERELRREAHEVLGSVGTKVTVLATHVETMNGRSVSGGTVAEIVRGAS